MNELNYDPFEDVNPPKETIQRLQAERDALQAQLDVAMKAIKDMRWHISEGNNMHAIQIAYDTEAEIAKLREKK